ncbi:phage baseplate assembly protein V [Flammeovirga kamogawensis]|uniref:Gp5/Type VI secretion system Vgr protein OB-fold domain-containing protein n=1 Tax=Flammeovirga kamogawensis TaxID=373891 RepID=A0ABX8GZ22_9BACT|nr:phage baseplate assembly protein V [Flammeovirga kamogawensis]MBB6458861.1 hypothetical protein [Flammeovirga kamogawensis]QWG08442.1 hypothetical protein KM029_05765 [Flammeovirga kamogawensis]TRX66739.1 hypothetical protein EO216_00825 [Flammeovirga kamogawensis]
MEANKLNYLISRVTLEIEGKEMPIRSVNLHDLKANYMINGVPDCVVTLLNNNNVIEFGAYEEFKPLNAIKVYIENEAKGRYLLFDGIISKIGTESYGQYFLTKLYITHPIYKLKRRKTNRIFDTNLEGILEKLLIDHDINITSATDGSASDNKVSKIIQYQQTDFDFLLLKSKEIGKMINATQEGVGLVDCLEDVNGKLLITPHTTFQFNVYTDIQSVYDEAVSYSYLPEDQSVENEESEAISLDVGTVEPKDIVSEFDKEIPLQNILYGLEDIERKKKIATNQIVRSLLGQVKGGVTIEGQTELNCGDYIKIEEAGVHIDSLAFIYSIEHHMDNDIWKTTIYLGYPDILESDVLEVANNNLTNLHHGIVKKIVTNDESDVTDKYLVKVEVPLMMMSNEKNDEEPEIWARVSSMFAGKDHGVLWMPEVEDEVIVGFLGGHADNAVILGSLFKNSDEHPHLGTEGHRSIVSKNNLSIIFNDNENLIEIKTPGNKILLDEENGVLSSAIMDGDTPVVECIMNKDNELILRNTDGEITIEGDKVNIIGKNGVNITSDNNLELTGKEISQKSNGKMAIEASNNLDIKGQMINLN